MKLLNFISWPYGSDVNGVLIRAKGRTFARTLRYCYPLLVSTCVKAIHDSHFAVHIGNSLTRKIPVQFNNVPFQKDLFTFWSKDFMTPMRFPL